MSIYREILQRVWGYPDFRPGQEPVIQSVAEGLDTLALLPTGAGKSLCYQVPALAGKGMTLVISPLIALMKDQVDHLKKRGVQAEAIYSGMSYSTLDRILDNAVFGGVKLLYISPERLHTTMAEARIRQMNLDLIAIDEAHCISQWGYDFRPAYLEIATLREWHPNVPFLALTATAIPEVVEDIQRKLAFRDSRVVKTTFRRPNLSFRVYARIDKEIAMLQCLQKMTDGSAIVYVRSRRRTEEYARFLSERGIVAKAFHAGLSTEDRKTVQEAWQRGDYPVMVATNAFGMGIDKPDVRVVIHIDLPDSLEAYYQEAGRAGRDGLPADAILLAGEWDMANLESRFETSFPPLSQIRQTYRAIGSYLQLAYGSGEGESFDFDLAEFCQRFNFKPVPTLTCLKILEESGWVSLTESVFQPATIQITVSQTDLYQHQLNSPKLDLFIKALMRAYQGIFQYPVSIRESELARTLDTSTLNVVNMLNFMEKSGLCNYHPRKDKPQLTFMQERVDADYISFDQEMLHFRKQRQKERLAAIRVYLNSPDCRQLTFMRYFGEDNETPCQRCDHCEKALLGGGNTKKIYQELQERLELWIKEAPSTQINHLKANFTTEELEIVREILQEWSDESQIKEVNGNIVWQH
jgi:ATP-dependent DNA helicase RecQ